MFWINGLRNLKVPAGRPTNYTPEIGKFICDKVSTHPVGYRILQDLYPEIPSYQTLLEWRAKFSEFGERYLNAKRFQSEILVEEIDSMIPDGIRYYIDDKGQERIDAPSAGLIIAKINNRKWTASKLAPKIYGDRKELENVQAENETIKAELAKLRAELDAKNKRDY